MSTPTPALEVRNLTVQYGKRTAVRDLSFGVGRGEVVALLGPNGAGKSTAMLAIAGVVPPTAGTVLVAGADAGEDPLNARGHVGFADQPPRVYEFLTVREHLAFVAEARGETDPSAGDGLIDRLGLSEMGDRLCRELSFGMRQRVGLAAALVGAPSVVLLDETLNGLDPRAAKRARGVVAGAAKSGAAVLMSTHLLGVAELLCQRIVIMAAGELRVDVAGDELKALLNQGPGALESLYLEHVPDEGAG